MTNKLLITGGNGFFGKHIQAAMQVANINYLAPKSSELDILNFNQLSSYLAENKPDTILHMAAKCTGILGNKHNPAVFIRDNTQMALNIYEAARQNNITNLSTLGSVCMYPKFCKTPFSEDDIWLGYPEETNAPYGIAKRSLLMLHQTYREQYNFTGTFFLPVNMYGFYDSFDPINSHVIPALIRKFTNAIEKNLLTVECWGTGSATREFLWAPDCAEIITKTVKSNFSHPTPINIGTGKDISIKDLSVLVAKLTGYTDNIIFTGEVSDGQPKRLLDVSRAKQLLNWEATTMLEDGLKQTIAWYQANKQNIP